jgi:hypothetical protein
MDTKTLINIMIIGPFFLQLGYLFAKSERDRLAKEVAKMRSVYTRVA